MAHLRIGSRGSANRISALLGADLYHWPAKARAKTERNSSNSEHIPNLCSHDRSTLALLKWGFGEYYQCGYWAALENRGSRLFAAARGSNPLLSAALRDPQEIRRHSTGKRLLTHPSSDASLKMVLKRGPASSLGGLTSRLSYFYDILPRVFSHV